jgi:hypothetical protein
MGLISRRAARLRGHGGREASRFQGCRGRRAPATAWFIGVGGRFAARAGFVHAPVAFCPRGRYGRSPILVHAPRDVFPLLNAGSWRSSTRSSSSISGSPGAANGALIEYASPHPHPPYRQARPKRSGAPATQRCRQFPRRCWRRAARSSSDARSWRSALDPEPARIVVRGS